MFRKLLVPLFTAIYLLGCGQGTDQLLDGQHNNHSEDIYTETSLNHENATKDHKNKVDDTALEEDQQKDDLELKSKTKKNNTLSDLKVHYIDAGQADATLFQYTDDQENRYTILYDTGDWNRNDVINYLAAQNINYIDLVVVSHPHADHIGQLADIIKTYEVGEVWLSGNVSSSKTFQKSVEGIMASNADYYEPRRGETFEIGPMEIEVLHPKKLSGDLNKDSLSLRFIYGDVKFVFTGDAYKRQELQMLNSGMEVEADIIQLGHHGSNTSSDQTFLKAVNPKVAVYSAGKNNSYGHPHDEVVSRIQNLNIDLYGTDTHGTIIITTDGADFEIFTKDDGTISPQNTKTSNDQQNDDQLIQAKQKNKETTKTCIDINQASYEEVQNIIHIGPERAQDLIDQRPYDKVDDLTKINGIGPARIADIKEEGLACIGG